MANNTPYTPDINSDSADFVPSMGDYKTLQPFRYWCQKVLPLVYDDSLSYYELLCKVVDYLNKTMEDVETLNGDIEDMYTAFGQLQGYTNTSITDLRTDYQNLVSYVNNYFNTLDVQNEINNKLDAMATNGTLSALVSPFLPTLVSAWLADNITPTTPAVDKSLSISGAAADAKVVGDILSYEYSGYAENLSVEWEWTNNKAVNYANGNEITNQTNLKLSAYIDVSDLYGFWYTQIIIESDSAPYNGIAFYDEEYTFIDGTRSEYSSAAGYNLKYVPVPDGAKYARFSAWNNNLPDKVFMLFDPDEYKASLPVSVKSKDLIIPTINITPTVYAQEEVEGIIANNGTVNKSTGRRSIEIPNVDYKFIAVTARLHQNAYVSFLKSSTESLSDGATADFCTGEEGRHTISPTTTTVLEVPEDCEVINFMSTYTPLTRGYIPTDITVITGNIFNIFSATISSTFEDSLDAMQDEIDGLALCHSKTEVTACIIGASIEAGTTHETSTSGAVIDPTKAYLTVALQNNGVVVTNMSHGGMGFVRTSSSGGYKFKDIVDSTDFTQFNSCYVCLGYNDYNHNQPLGSVDDAKGTNTVCGMLKYGIETIYDDNPSIKLFIKNMNGSGGLNSASVPYTQHQLYEAMKAICDSYGVEMIVLGAIANTYNRNTVYPDGVHPSQAVMALMAKDTTGRITYK